MSDKITDYAALFSSPYNQPQANGIGAIALAYLQAVQQEFDEKLQKEPNAALFFIDPSIEPQKNAWSPEAGIAWKAARENRIAHAALQLALAWARIGAEGSVYVSLPERIRLFFEGYLFEVSGQVKIVLSENAITVELKDRDQKIEWMKQAKKWKLQDTESPANLKFLNWAPLVEADEESASYIIDPGYEVAADGYKLPDDADSLPYVSNWPNDYQNEIRVAQAYAHKHAPSYTHWRERVSAGFLLCDRKDKTMQTSCSSFLLPGLILIGKGAPVYYCGELLVHEASHQYLNVCGLLGSLTNNGDKQLYYSPIKRAHRTIERLLVAAHANANMLLYYAEIVKNGVDIKDVNDRMDYLLDAFNQTREPLAKTIGLTPLGRAVYERVISELDKQEFSWVKERTLLWLDLGSIAIIPETLITQIR